MTGITLTDLQTIVDDAARFRETYTILKEWLYRRRIHIVEWKWGEYAVILEDQQQPGQYLSKQHFPSYAQALDVALQEAVKRISGASA
jgi:hypothetical protein